MIVPSNFAFHVTYTCPLACAHCCFSSNPENNDSLPIEHILETINNLDTSTIEMVAFTGGEPFLLGDKLVEAVKRASQRGFVTRVVTSAYFGKHLNVAEKRVGELKQAGLSEISISWDDFHEKYVTFDCVYNVFWTALELDIFPAVNVVQSRDSSWTAERVRKELGIDASPASKDMVVESSLNLTGRAKSELKDAGFRLQRYVGPCPYVLTGPTLSAKNKLLACCGVIPDTDDLVLDSNFKPENLSTAIDQGLKSPLLNWLHLRGPYSIMEYISKKHGVSIPEKKEIGGNCEACRILFNTRQLKDKIPEVIAEKLEEISGELHVLDALNLNEPETILKLWEADATVVEMAPVRKA